MSLNSEKTLFISKILQRPCLFLDLETSSIIPDDGLILEIGAIYAHWGLYNMEFRTINETLNMNAVPIEKILPEALKVNNHYARENFSCDTVDDFKNKVRAFFKSLPHRPMLIGKMVTTFDYPWLYTHFPDIFSFNLDKSIFSGFIEVSSFQNVFVNGPIYRDKSKHNAMSDIQNDIDYLYALFNAIRISQ